MNVLVIPEDFRHDQYLLKPLFQRLFRAIGRPRARVRVCRDPLLGGIGEALKSERIQEVVDQHDGMTDIFILCVDRDGNRGRRARLDQIESEFGNGRVFFAENAWEEIETWALAGLVLPTGWTWAGVRAEVSVKERYFDVLAKERGVADGPGGGRKTLGEEAAHNIPAIRQKCPEDFDSLARRLEALA